MQLEVDILTRSFQALYAPRGAVEEWKRRVGFDKRRTIAVQKQRIWTLACRELVDLLGSFYSPRRWFTRSTISEEVYQGVSQLLHFSHPELWPDCPKRVRKRYPSGS
jgi:hypothetical protein